MRDYRFIMVLEHRYDRGKTVSYPIYATTNSEANLKAQLLYNRVLKINHRAHNYDLKEVVYDPESLMHA